MDRITKFLRRLNVKEREEAERVIQLVQEGNLSGLDVKKLKGMSQTFRVRKGSIRIIFTDRDDVINLIFIERRGSKTYK